MAHDYFHYWKPSTVDHNLGRGPLNHTSGNQLNPGRINAGDTIWVATVRNGVLLLAGRIIVGRIIRGQKAAENFLRTSNLWEAEFHVIAKPGTEENLQEVNIEDIAASLRFQSPSADCLTVTNGRVNAQQLQSLRKLTPESVALLQQRWGKKTTGPRPQSTLRDEARKTADSPKRAAFVRGRIYRRRELHALYGGQRQGGISTPSGQPFVLLFTGKTGLQYGYQDGWSKEGIFMYTGEGTKGDMALVRGNLAIQDHVKDGKDIHLFEQVDRGRVRYVGQMICTGFHQRCALDADGNDRQAIVFELTPIDIFNQTVASDDRDEDPTIWKESLDVLRKRAVASSAPGRTPSERKMLVQYRSDAVKVYTMRRANGVCEACGQPAPFMTGAGRPYLETHHIRRLSDGGPDHPRWVIAVCPNCHRRAHYGNDKSDFNQKLANIAGDREHQ